MNHKQNPSIIAALFLLLLSHTVIGDSSNILSATQTQARHSEERIPLEQSWHFSSNTKRQLLNAKVNQTIEVAAFPQLVKLNNEKFSPVKQSIEVTRYNLMAPGAKITVLSSHGKHTIAPIDVMAFSAAKHGLGMLIDNKTGDVTGMVIEKGISFNITGNLQTGLDFRLSAVPKNSHDASSSCLMSIENQPGDPLADMKMAMNSHSLVPHVLGAIDYEAILAIDTDNEWMTGKSNNTTDAMNYINTLFVNMNVYFERDAALHFLMGDVTLRIANDPYPTENNISNALTDFGEYWRVNNSEINRNFAALLSGQNIGSNSFSGIAWVDAYCEKGSVFGNQTYGSYSVNRIGTNAGTGFVSQFLAHELGHNLGSPHTHCYTPALDNCYNAEGGDCFAGTPTCPAGGKGTIMSYCHVGAPDGAGCGLSDDEFHPTVINLFNSNLALNSPSCIAPFGTDLIFEDGFDN